VNGLPTELIDRWENRAEPRDGEGLLYWHMLLGTDPDAVALAKEGQGRLARFSGLHMTPLERLHMSVLIAGAADAITAEQTKQMAAAASRLLADVPPIMVTVGKVLYHPEAIMLAARPAEALAPVLDAARGATREATGSPGQSATKLASWTPHITIAYSTAHQPAAPVIAALGRNLPERSLRISSVSVVNQQGPERCWSWKLEATIPLGGNGETLHVGPPESDRGRR
jgi:2'-5' RNA ligase